MLTHLPLQVLPTFLKEREQRRKLRNSPGIENGFSGKGHCRRGVEKNISYASISYAVKSCSLDAVLKGIIALS